MVSRCWLLDCCIASLFKLRITFPWIASPLHLAGIGQRRNWKRSGNCYSPSCSPTGWWQGLGGPPGPPPPPDCGTVAHSSPPAHGQILSNRTAKAGATQGNSLPENLHTLPFTVSQWQPEVVGYSALLPRLSTRGSWSSDHPTLPLRLQFLPLLCNALVSVINFLSPNTRDLNRTKVNENRTSQTERPLKKCS